MTTLPNFTTQVYTDYPSTDFSGSNRAKISHVGDPQIISTSDGNTAIGIYTNCVDETSAANDQSFYSFGGDNETSGDEWFRFGFYQRLTNINTINTGNFYWPSFFFKAYLIVGTLAQVQASIQDLSTYDPPIPVYQ